MTIFERQTGVNDFDKSNETKIMKITTLAILTFFLTSVFCAGKIAAQSVNPAALYAAPSRLTLPGDERENAEQRAMIIERFYPVGFSKDGKFAYLVEPADEACGCYFADLIIQDLRTDKILWKKEYRGEEGSDNTKSEDFWRKNQKAFSAKLKQYGIVAGKDFALKTGSFDYEGDGILPKLEVALDTADLASYKVKGKITLTLASKRRGSKTLYERRYDLKESNSISGAEIGGMIVSPFETRAIVILIETHRGYEGPPDITRLKIVGADLKNGFGSFQSN